MNEMQPPPRSSTATADVPMCKALNPPTAAGELLCGKQRKAAAVVGGSQVSVCVHRGISQFVAATLLKK